MRIYMLFLVCANLISAGADCPFVRYRNKFTDPIDQRCFDVLRWIDRRRIAAISNKELRERFYARSPEQVAQDLYEQVNKTRNVRRGLRS